MHLSLSADWREPLIPLIMNADGRLLSLLHPNSPSSIDKIQHASLQKTKGEVDKRDKKRHGEQVQNEKGGREKMKKEP